jgi:hypothetical protein
MQLASTLLHLKRLDFDAEEYLFYILKWLDQEDGRL